MKTAKYRKLKMIEDLMKAVRKEERNAVLNEVDKIIEQEIIKIGTLKSRRYSTAHIRFIEGVLYKVKEEIQALFARREERVIEMKCIYCKKKFNKKPKTHKCPITQYWVVRLLLCGLF